MYRTAVARSTAVAAIHTSSRTEGRYSRTPRDTQPDTHRQGVKLCFGRCFHLRGIDNPLGSAGKLAANVSAASLTARADGPAAANTVAAHGSHRRPAADGAATRRQRDADDEHRCCRCGAVRAQRHAAGDVAAVAGPDHPLRQPA